MGAHGIRPCLLRGSAVGILPSARGLGIFPQFFLGKKGDKGG